MKLLAGLACLLLAPSAYAHQPVQDMAPRWQGGFGVQVREEYRSSNDLLDGRADAPDPDGRTERVRETWIEAVYTFRREVRVTAKIPWVRKDRIVAGGAHQSARGFGDLQLAVPLKRYRNEGRATRNWGFTPQVRLPIGSTSGNYPVGDGSWDVGGSVSYSQEDPLRYLLAEAFYWKNGSGTKGINQGDQLGLDLNLGLHPLHSSRTNSGAFVMWDVSARYEAHGKGSSGDTGGKRVSTGPVLVLYWQNLMARAEYKWPAYERVWGTQLSRGNEITLSIGAAF